MQGESDNMPSDGEVARDRSRGEKPGVKGRIRGALSSVKKVLQRLAWGSKQFLTSELDKVKQFSRHLAREIVALFVMAIVAGIALAALLKSFAFDILMPLAGLVSPGGDWRNLQIRVGESRFNIGSFLAHLVFFIVVLLIVLLLLRLMPKRPELVLPRLVKNCPSCGEILPQNATECDACGTTFFDIPGDE